jgi:Flp pilus assembly protein TadD
MPALRHTVIVLSAGASLCNVSCKAASKLVAEQLSPAPSASAEKVRGRPATEAEARQFASEIERAVKGGRGLGELVDAEAIIARGLRDLELSRHDATAAARGMTAKFSEALQLVLNGGGGYKLLQNRVIDGERRVKFRLLHADGAFNYNDYVVVNQDGKLKAIDIHVLITGEFVSETLRRTLLPVAVEAKKSLWERLTEKESAYVEHLPSIMKMSNARTDPKGALATYAALPEVLKKDKNVLTFRVQAASMLDDAEYLAATEDFRRAFPHDASVQVMSIDYFYMKKMFKEALQAVTALEKSSGRDAHLNTLRAGLYAEMEDVEAGRKEVAAALELEPDLGEAFNLGIALDLAAREETAALTKIRDARRRGLSLAMVEQNPEYTAFLARRDIQNKLLDSPPAAK